MRRKKTMKRWKTRKYYELRDLFDILVKPANSSGEFLNLLHNTLIYPATYSQEWALNSYNSNFMMYDNLFEYITTPFGHWSIKENFWKCFWQIATRHREDIIYAIDEEDDTAGNRNLCNTQFLLSLIFIAQQTADKYVKLLELYSSEKEKLMDALENITSETHDEESNEDVNQENASSVSGSKSGTSHQDTASSSDATESTHARTRFSDTPELAGMYDDDKYTTNLTNGDVDGESESSAESSVNGETSESNSQTASTSGSSTATKEIGRASCRERVCLSV